VLRELCRGRVTVLVTGTNGKTTTTRMLATALTRLGPVASNDTGANMPDGLVAALARARRATWAVLEIDEGYLPAVLPDVNPAVVVLLNLHAGILVGPISAGTSSRDLPLTTTRPSPGLHGVPAWYRHCLSAAPPRPPGWRGRREVPRPVVPTGRTLAGRAAVVRSHRSHRTGACRVRRDWA
jgi:hypothetical protein